MINESRRLPIAASMYLAKVPLEILLNDQLPHQEEFTMTFVLAVPDDDDWTSGCGVVQTRCRQHAPFQAPILALQVACQQGMITPEQYDAAIREVRANATRNEVKPRTNGKTKGTN